MSASHSRQPVTPGYKTLSEAEHLEQLETVGEIADCFDRLVHIGFRRKVSRT